MQKLKIKEQFLNCSIFSPFTGQIVFMRFMSEGLYKYYALKLPNLFETVEVEIPTPVPTPTPIEVEHTETPPIEQPAQVIETGTVLPDVPPAE